MRTLRFTSLSTVLGLLIVSLSACSPGPDPSALTPMPTMSSPAPSGSVSPSASSSVVIPPSAFPCTSPIPTAAAPDAAHMDQYRDVIVSANTQPMASTSCDTVTLIFSGSECCGALGRDDALVQWGDWLYRPGSTWTFAVDPATLADWRTHFYAQYVPEGSLIALDLPNQRMTSVIFDGNVVTGLFCASIEEMTY